MRIDIVRDWLRYSWTARFFSNFDGWREMAPPEMGYTS